MIFVVCGGGARAAVWEVNARHPQAADTNPGTAERPFKTISRAAQAVAPGDTVRIHDGVYRESVVVEKSGTAEKPITFAAAPGAHVVLTGADRITDWKKEAGMENVYSTPWPHRFIGWNKSFAHPDDDYHRVIGRAEQVFILGYPMHQVLKREELGRGTFFADVEGQRLYVCPRDGRDLAKGDLVEAAVRGEVWQSRGAYIHLRGVRVRYAANPAQRGAATFSGAGDVVEDCAFEQTNGQGAVFGGEGITARRCVFQENGELGFGGSHAHRLLMQDCLIRNNNIKGFDRGWEAGGTKICMSRGVVIDRCQVLENRGNGIWFDIGNEDCEVRNCLIADNECAGIFYEISYGLRAHDNVITGNGFAEYPGAWGSSSGIAVSSSPGCVIERNLLVGNKEGFNFREQDRTTPRIDGGREEWVWNHDEVIRNNVLALNRDAQTWGWFDCRDGRHWPTAMQAGMMANRQANGQAGNAKKGNAGKDKTGKKQEDIAGVYKAKGKEGAPEELNLEKLKITFEKNVYEAAPGEGLFNWGPSWSREKKYYTRLEEVRQELGLENGSHVAVVGFGDVLRRDYRVPAGGAVMQTGCYPQGNVPGVMLGRLE